MEYMHELSSLLTSINSQVTVKYITVQHSAVQYIGVQYNLVQWCTMRYTTVLCSVIHYSASKKEVHYCTILYYGLVISALMLV